MQLVKREISYSTVADLGPIRSTVKMLAQEQGKSLSKLSRDAGRAPSWLGVVLKRDMITQRTLDSVASALGVSSDDLIERARRLGNVLSGSQSE